MTTRTRAARRPGRRSAGGPAGPGAAPGRTGTPPATGAQTEADPETSNVIAHPTRLVPPVARLLEVLRPGTVLTPVRNTASSAKKVTLRPVTVVAAPESWNALVAWEIFSDKARAKVAAAWQKRTARVRVLHEARGLEWLPLPDPDVITWDAEGTTLTWPLPIGEATVTYRVSADGRAPGEELPEPDGPDAVATEPDPPDGDPADTGADRGTANGDAASDGTPSAYEAIADDEGHLE